MLLSLVTTSFALLLSGTVTHGDQITLLVEGDKSITRIHPTAGSLFSVPVHDHSVYMVSVQAAGWVYQPVRVDVGAESIVARVWNGSGAFIGVPLELAPIGMAGYFEGEAGFNPMAMLRNPMMLMMVVMLGCSTLLPKALEAMDPEALAEAQGKPIGGASAAGGAAAKGPFVGSRVPVLK